MPTCPKWVRASSPSPTTTRSWPSNWRTSWPAICGGTARHFAGDFITIDEALDKAAGLRGPVCLLDMGDNVGGGSPGDGTLLAQAIHERKLPKSFVCLCDPEVRRPGPGDGRMGNGPIPRRRQVRSAARLAARMRSDRRRALRRPLRRAAAAPRRLHAHGSRPHRRHSHRRRSDDHAHQPPHAAVQPPAAHGSRHYCPKIFTCSSPKASTPPSRPTKKSASTSSASTPPAARPPTSSGSPTNIAGGRCFRGSGTMADWSRF